MPWKDGYTIATEKSTIDADVRWPPGYRCAFSITVDLSVASGPPGISEADLANPKTQFGLREGFARVKEALDRFGLKATFAVPAIMARVQARELRVLTQEGHEIAAEEADGEASAIDPELIRKLEEFKRTMFDPTRREGEGEQ